MLNEQDPSKKKKATTSSSGGGLVSKKKVVGLGDKPRIDFDKVLTEKAASLTSQLDAGGSVLDAMDKLSKSEGE